MIDYKRIKELLNIGKNNKDGLNYLFLDFDGVINTFIDFNNYEEIDLNHLANEECINCLNKLCNEYNLKVVLSTSWRHAGKEYCTNYLYENGFSKDIEIVGMTQVEKLMSRSEEIVEYLFEHNNFHSFVVVDDLDMVDIRDYLVLMDPYVGFNEEKYNEAVEVLNRFDE